MENKKSKIFKGSLVAGAMLSVTALSAAPNTSNLFNYNALGSGAEVRTEILNSNGDMHRTFEAKCGEESKAAKAESKSKEAKCGEGKCGEEGTKEAKAKTSKTEGKAKDAKCGEGKCGEDKKKAEAKTTEAKKSESKAKEAKCGEGKCGDE